MCLAMVTGMISVGLLENFCHHDTTQEWSTVSSQDRLGLATITNNI